MISDYNHVVLVDEDDQVVRIEDKRKAHELKGLLHRAYLVMLFDWEGRVLLARRSEKKELWGGYWDGTVASHPQLGETYIDSARKRILYELGTKSPNLEYISKFRYFAEDGSNGSEHEICAILTGIIHPFEISLNLDEISEIKFMTAGELKEDIQKNEETYCPWFKIALMYGERNK